MTQRTHLFFLLTILLLGALLRFWGISFGLPGTFRPDEEYLVSRALFFHSGDFNPKLFNWPTLYFYLSSAFFYLVRLLADWSGVLTWHELGSYLTATNYAPAHLLGRILTACFGVAGLAATYQLGKVAFAPIFPKQASTAGLFSALLLCVTFIHVRDSHFFATDIPLAFFATLALVSFFRISQGGGWKDYLLGALWSGLAMGTKYTALSLGIPFAVAHFLKLFHSKTKPWHPQELKYVLLAAPLCFLLFFLTSPYILLDWETFQSSTAVVENFAKNGLAQLPTQFGYEWIFLFCVPQALGTPLLALCLLGGAIFLVQRKQEGLVLLALLCSFILPVLCVYSSVKWSPIRYITFLTPAFAVLATAPLCALLALAKERSQVHAFAALSFLICACTLPRIFSLNETLSRTDTRIATAGWITRNLPRSATLYSPTYFSYALPQFTEKQRIRYVKQKPAQDRYFTIVDRAPIAFSEPLSKETEEELTNSALLFSLGPRHCTSSSKEGPPWAIYDESDAFYTPLSEFSIGSCPGPVVDIFPSESSTYLR